MLSTWLGNPKKGNPRALETLEPRAQEILLLQLPQPLGAWEWKSWWEIPAVGGHGGCCSRSSGLVSVPQVVKEGQPQPLGCLGLCLCQAVCCTVGLGPKCKKERKKICVVVRVCIPALRKLRQGNCHQFQANLGYSMRACFKENGKEREQLPPQLSLKDHAEAK